jgi:hypothetical protein
MVEQRYCSLKQICEDPEIRNPMATWAWGAKDMVAMEDGLRFKTTGMVKNKGYVTIKLNGRDLYDIEFGKSIASKSFWIWYKR